MNPNPAKPPKPPMLLIYSDNEVNPEEKMARLAKHAFMPDRFWLDGNNMPVKLVYGDPEFNVDELVARHSKYASRPVRSSYEWKGIDDLPNELRQV